MMFILADLDPGLVGLVTTVLGGGFLYAWVAYRKVGPETEAIGNKSLIEVNSELRTEINRQSKLIDRLREQNDRQELLIHEQEKSLTRAENHIRALTQELNDLESRRDELGA
jgi:flagellar motility protein MotE (MotC chaperone)